MGVAANKVLKCFDDARARDCERDIELAPERITIRRTINGVAMKVAIPSTAYRGIVLSLLMGATGRTHYRVSLWHTDADLRVSLFDASDDHDVVAEWKRWAAFFNLPKFIEREAGRLEGEEKRVGATAIGPREGLRRRSATLSKRRPRAFLRRKSGDFHAARQLTAVNFSNDNCEAS